MKLVVGLGNPGEKYKRTRHNVGFDAVDQVAATNYADPWKDRFDGLTAECQIAGERVLLLKPMSFMNRSGGAVRKAIDFFKLTPAETLVVCDDFSLPLGVLRLRTSGSAGGQNGLKDVILHLGTDAFSRLRIGIGEPPERIDPADYVLSGFSPAEKQTIAGAVIDAGLAVERWCREGAAAAMNRFNGKRADKE
jgi:PTH1 family peptidyl-tRNA hydrolase